LIDNYYDDGLGGYEVKKEAIPLEHLNDVFVRDDGAIITRDDIGDYTYPYSDSNNLLQKRKLNHT